MFNINTRSITGDGGLPIFLAVPENLPGPVPAIVLMHERYGFVKHTQELAERIAGDGFVCMAPDFFFKHPDQEALHAGDARYDMNDDEAAELLDTAVDHLEQMDDVADGCIAIMGVCQTVARKRKQDWRCNTNFCRRYFHLLTIAGAYIGASSAIAVMTTILQKTSA